MDSEVRRADAGIRRQGLVERAGPSTRRPRGVGGIIAGMTDPTTPPAGWYDDGRGALRYWDGTQWTEHTAPLAPAAEQAAYPATSADQAATTPYGADVPADQAATTPYGAVAPADQSATTPYGAASVDGYATAPYAAAATPGSVPPSRPAPGSSGPNILGFVALAIAVVGFIFACIPFVQFVAWILLPIAFVLSIVALFLTGRKWPAITGLIVSVVGGIVGAIVFAFVALNVVGQVIDSEEIQDEITEQLEEEFGNDEQTEPAPDDETVPDDEAVPAEALSFGDTMAWENGVEMTVSAPEPYTPSEAAAGADQANHIVFTMTITNNSTENLQPLPYTRLSSGGQEGSQIFDATADGGQIGIPPTTVILPGQSVTWQDAWSVADVDALTMQTAPSFDYDDVIFTNVQ